MVELGKTCASIATNQLNRKKKPQDHIVEKHGIDTIISDNRFGVINNNTYNVIISHQLFVKMPQVLYRIANPHNLRLLNKFDEIWIPDVREEPSLSGELSHPTKSDKIKFIGPISRLYPNQQEEDIDVLIVISGPEPHRSLLVASSKALFKEAGWNTVMIAGDPNEQEQSIGNLKNIAILYL